MEFIVKRLPVMDPPIKLIPIMKLIGSVIVSLKIKFTFSFFVLFCMLTIRSNRREKLNIKVNNIFLNVNNISKANLIHIINITFRKIIFFG